MVGGLVTSSKHVCDGKLAASGAVCTVCASIDVCLASTFSFLWDNQLGLSGATAVYMCVRTAAKTCVV